MSKLIKRVKFLEEEEKKHLTVISNKNRKLKDMDLDLEVKDK